MSRGFALVLVLFFLIASTIVVVEPVNCSEDVWITRAPIPVAMYVYGLALVNDQVFAFGADAGRKALTYAYNPASDAWVEKTPMPTSRLWCTIVAYQGKVYVIGGVLDIVQMVVQILTGVNEMYDPSTDNWTIKTSMPTPRTSMDGTL